MLHIAFIDDEKDLLEIYRDLFQQEGLTIHTFSEGQLAVDSILALELKCIFIDYSLAHGVSGVQLAKSLPPQIDKYLLTGDGSINLGLSRELFKQVLEKPFDDLLIRSIISQYLPI